MIRFIQTSDWQIGMKGGGLGEAGPIVRDMRIKSIHNVFKTAKNHKVDFVLLCGDIFEHNMISQEDVKKVVTIFNRYPDISIYLLPGNHDILGADCVYNREIFQRVKHLTILSTSDAVEVDGGTLHPCPIISRYVTQGLTSIIPDVRKAEGIHIGVGHGSLVGKIPVQNWEEIDLPIDPNCIDRTGLDYLALGHWHSYRTFEDNNGIKRIAYSGTHEQTKYDEDGAGQCLLVEIDKKGAEPKIEAIKTGQLTWVSREFEMKDSSSLIELKDYFESIEEVDLVRLVFYGELPLECKEELDNVLEFQTTVHKNFRVKLESLDIVIPPQLESSLDFGDPTLNQTGTYLKELLENESDTKQKRILTEAIAYFQRYVKEVGE